MRLKHLVSSCFFAGVVFFTGNQLLAQKPNYIGQELNTVTSAVPFLQIGPDSRAGGMGEAGVSSTPDANSLHWNPAKYAFIDSDMGFSLSYSPWLRALVSDINLAYLTGFKKIGDDQAVAGSLIYFSLGDIIFTEAVAGEVIGTYRPNEFAISGAYSRKLTNRLSGAVSARFIHSNLTQGQEVAGASTKPGNSIAADIAVYSEIPLELNNIAGARFAWGVNISNIGAKISYSDDNTQRDFIPTNLRLGPSLHLDIDEFNSLAFMVDFNKLLIPTPPIYDTAVDANGNPLILYGKDPNVSVPVGMIQSFYDAPGGFEEELHEISIAAGVEYWYDKQFALRAGYFHEHATKGNRKFFTLGAGLRYNVFGLDFSYLVPVDQLNPLGNTLRFTLHFDFQAFRDQNKEQKL